MGTKVREQKNKSVNDIELNPKVQAKRKELFDLYVFPFRNMIYKLCIKYSWEPCNVEENYTEVLTNFYRRIETYDPNRPIRTWLHIVTKRYVQSIEKKRKSHSLSEEIENMNETGGNIIDDSTISYNVMGVENYREYYNDDILSLLDEMKPIHRDALILQEAGYSLKEIVEVEYQKGSLKSKNIDTIKSRLFLARQYLKKYLNRNGERVFNKTDDDSCDQNRH